MLIRIINQKISNFFKTISSFIVVILVLILFITGLYFSFLLPKIFAIIIMASVSCLSTILIIKYYPKLESKSIDTKRSNKDSNKELEINNLKSQLERAEKMSLRLDKISDIHEVGLKKISLSITDFKEKEISKKDLSFSIPLYGKINDKEEIIEYKGVLNKSLIIKYGLDLSRIKIFNNDGIIYVSNIDTKFIGYESNQNNWKLREFRRKIEKDKKYEIIIDDERLIKESELQEKDLMDRIANNVDLGEFSNIIEESNKNYIRETLQYLNMEIKFVDSLETYQEGINAFLEAYKIEINSRLNSSTLRNNN
jgi:hypothetical protein